MNSKHQDGHGTCRGPRCGAPIIWEETQNGKRMPLNLDGTPHWSTCTDREYFKDKKKGKK